MSGTVMSEVFTALLTGRLIVTMIFMIVAGWAVGWGTRSITGKLGWSALVVFVFLFLFTTSGYVMSLTRIGATGVLPRGMSDNILISLTLIFGAVYLLVMWGGSSAATEAQAEDAATAMAMTASDFAAEIDIATAHPGLGRSGWVAQRWHTMTTEEKREWAEARLDALRHLRRESLGGKLADHGVQLPVRLAEIDHQ